MIGTFGLDGRRPRIIGMEPSKVTFYYKGIQEKYKKGKNAEGEEDEE